MNKTYVVLAVIACLLAASVSAGKTADYWYSKPQGITSALVTCTAFPCLINPTESTTERRDYQAEHLQHWLMKRLHDNTFRRYAGYNLN